MKFLPKDHEFTPKERASIYLRAARRIYQHGGEHYCLAAVENLLNPHSPRIRGRKPKIDIVDGWPSKFLFGSDAHNKLVDEWLDKKWEINAINMPELSIFMPDGGHYNQCWWGHADFKDPADAWKFECNILALLLAREMALEKYRTINM